MKYALNWNEPRAADRHCQAQFDKTGNCTTQKKDRIGSPPKYRHSNHSGQILNRNTIQTQSAK
jgi:hypothetical protein